MRRLLAILIAALGWCAGAQAETNADAERYAACMERARTAPAEGLIAANRWLAESETVPGRHCRAAALSGLGRRDDAVAELEAMGRSFEQTDPALAADLYRQAALIEFAADEFDRAETLQDRGLKLAPESVELLIDRALLLGVRDRYEESLEVLERARSVAPARADVLVLTAAAHRLLGHDAEAETNLSAALAIEPDNADALLERGILRRLRNDKEGARADWERVRALAPDSPEAETAAANLKLLDQPAPLEAEPE
jgi:tetratricopeptide (TPR) repeat protein